MANAGLDQNSRPTLTALSNVDGTTIVQLWADPVTHRLLVDLPSSVSGSGTTNFVAKWTSASTLGNSIIYDNGTGVGIGTSNPQATLTVSSLNGFSVTNSGGGVGTQGTLEINRGSILSPVSSRISFGTDGTGWQLRIGKNQAGTMTDFVTLQDDGKVGIGITSPVTLLANTAVGTLDQLGTGVSATGFAWSTANAGYVSVLNNSNSATNAQGVLVKIMGVSSSNRLLTLNANGTDVILFRGDGTASISGAVTGGSYNKVTITTPATGSTLTISDGKTLTANNSITLAGTDGKTLTLTNALTVTTNDGTLAFGAAAKTLTVNNSITLAGTDATTMTFPTTSATIARTDAGQTFTGTQVMTSPKILTSVLDTNGNISISMIATASAVNYVELTNNSTGTTGPLIAAQGEANTDLRVSGKGTGKVHSISGSYHDITAYSPAAAGTATLTLNTSNTHNITMPAGNITIAVSNVGVGQWFVVRIIQDATGSRTVTWFTTIKWAGGSAPTLTTTANKADTFLFLCTSANNYDGYIVGQNV